MTLKNERTTKRSRSMKNHLKDVFLEMLQTMPFSQVRVTGLCRRAHVARVTFYAYYLDIYDLLDDTLQDALVFLDSITDRNCTEAYDDLWEVARANDLELFKAYNDRLPPCYRLIDIPKYIPLLKDDSLTSILTRKIFDEEKGGIVPYLMKTYGVSEFIAENIFWYVVSGSISVNKRIGWCKNDSWYELQLQVLRFVMHGYQGLGNKKES
ncbi:MAG: HTH tetR-type domain-containing protein [Succiniclasticum sp.]|jgi:AcrR family transcriptional regulator